MLLPQCRLSGQGNVLYWFYIELDSLTKASLKKTAKCDKNLFCHQCQRLQKVTPHIYPQFIPRPQASFTWGRDEGVDIPIIDHYENLEDWNGCVQQFYRKVAKKSFSSSISPVFDSSYLLTCSIHLLYLYFKRELGYKSILIEYVIVLDKCVVIVRINIIYLEIKFVKILPSYYINKRFNPFILFFLWFLKRLVAFFVDVPFTPRMMKSTWKEFWKVHKKLKLNWEMLKLSLIPLLILKTIIKRIYKVFQFFYRKFI